MRSLQWKLIPFVLFALLISFFWRGLSLDPHHLPSVQIGKPLPVFSLESLGKNNDSFTQETLGKQVALLNVWASWCAACNEEQVFLLQLAHEGVPIYGLNYKDDPQDAEKWLAEWGNPYRMIGKDLEGKVAIDLGVYGAPETFLVDKSGMIRYRHTGPLTITAWNQEFVPRIEQLKGQS